MSSSVENQTIKTENHQKNAYSMFAYYDNPQSNSYFLSTLYIHLSFINCHNIARAAVSSQSQWLFQWYVRLNHYCHTNTFAWLPFPIHQTSAKPTRVNLLKILSPPLFMTNLRLWPVVQLDVSISMDIYICMTNLCSGKRNSNHPGWFIHSFIFSLPY